MPVDNPKSTKPSLFQNIIKKLCLHKKSTVVPRQHQTTHLPNVGCYVFAEFDPNSGLPPPRGVAIALPDPKVVAGLARRYPPQVRVGRVNGGVNVQDREIGRVVGWDGDIMLPKIPSMPRITEETEAELEVIMQKCKDEREDGDTEMRKVGRETEAKDEMRVVVSERSIKVTKEPLILLDSCEKTHLGGDFIEAMGSKVVSASCISLPPMRIAQIDMACDSIIDYSANKTRRCPQLGTCARSCVQYYLYLISHRNIG
jgi:hypothetical protein